MRGKKALVIFTSLASVIGLWLWRSGRTQAAPAGTYDLADGEPAACYVEPPDSAYILNVYERQVAAGDIFNVSVNRGAGSWGYKIDYTDTEAGARLIPVSQLTVGAEEVFTFKAEGSGNVSLTIYNYTASPPDLETGYGIQEALLFSIDIGE